MTPRLGTSSPLLHLRGSPLLTAETERNIVLKEICVKFFDSDLKESFTPRPFSVCDYAGEVQCSLDIATGLRQGD